MPEESGGSVTIWIGDLKAGGDAAAQSLWERYFERLVRLARSQIRKQHGRLVVADEEDAALSAFDSFCRGARRAKFPHLADRNDLWRLLVVITQRKVANQKRYERAKWRGGGKMVSEVDLLATDEGQGGLDQTTGARLRFPGGVEVEVEPTPEFAAELGEECRRRLKGLSHEELRHVAVLKMEGYTDAEVAEKLGCTRRSVQRKLDRIRREWGGPDS